MQGNRDKIQDETLPGVEVVTHERRTEIRYNFSEVSETDFETGETRTSFNFKYIKVYDLNDVQISDGLAKEFKKIINDPAQIENPVAFKGRRWEELVCELEEDQTTKDKLLNGNTYTEKVLPMPLEGEWVAKGFYEFKGEYYGCIQPHTRMHYHPSKTPALFNKIPINFEGSDYPQWQQPTGSTDAYNIGDIVTLNGVLYKSRIDANTTNPEDYNDTDSPWNYWDKEPLDS